MKADVTWSAYLKYFPHELEKQGILAPNWYWGVLGLGGLFLVGFVVWLLWGALCGVFLCSFG